jgi:hypothetical protein
MGGQAEEEEQKKRKKSIFLHFACCFSALFRFPPNCVLRVYWFSVCKRKRKNFCIPKVAEELFGFFTFAMPLSGYRATVLESTESQQKYFCVRRKSYDGKLFLQKFSPRNFGSSTPWRALPRRGLTFHEFFSLQSRVEPPHDVTPNPLSLSLLKETGWAGRLSFTSRTHGESADDRFARFSSPIMQKKKGKKILAWKCLGRDN